MTEIEEEIVISGISGKFPQCENIEEFSAKLFAGVDMLTMNEQRLSHDLLVPRIGLINDISKFDAQYFSIHDVQAETMNPYERLLLELAHEAIIDSGTNPTQIRGSNIGVYIGQPENNHLYLWLKHVEVNNMPLLALGQAASLLANMTSYAYDLKGPSICISSSWSSSMSALHEAFRAIKRGDCEGALVAGMNLCQSDNESLQALSYGNLSSNGMSKPFDKEANGYVRSESVCVMYIQKKSQAKRVYTTISNIKTNTGGSFSMGTVIPDINRQTNLIQSVYREIGIDPLEVEYLEANATGIKSNDQVELASVTDAFCRERDTPLLIGSLKSNMGHSESASGMCSIMKVILAMERGIIPPTINYEKPNTNIPALYNGKLQVTDKPTPYKGGFVAVNNFGCGGSNVHAVLKPFTVTEKSQKTNNLPKLVAVSGRTKESVKYFLEKVEKSKSDYLVRLVHDIHSCGNIKHHFYRGYSIFGTEQPLKEIENYEDSIRPVWFVFPGTGAQYSGMGIEFMQFEVFRESIRKSSNVLEQYGIPMYDIINESREEILSKEVVLIAIAVIQCAFIDLLFSLGVYPDGIIGHSMGEAPAGYADGALTLEQTVLIAYFKTKAILESNLMKGSTASVGLPLSEAERHCPDGVYVACDNSDNNVTVSGPDDKIQVLVKSLQSYKIFVREVPNPLEFAVHSKYVEPALPIMQKYFQQVISSPKKRSTKWISTSVPSGKWNTELAQTASADYIVNNFKSPVLFRESLTYIPDNAIVIEVGPHCLFQGLLKQALPSTCINIGLSKRLHTNNLEYFLSSIGKLYNLGLQPKIHTLYPKVQYPVPRGTPGISNMVAWNHSKSWKSFSFVEFYRFAGGSKFIFQIYPNRDEHQFLKGHVLDGHILFPASGYLILAWRAFTSLLRKDIKNTSVKFENIHFYRATHIQDSDIEFEVDILSTSGGFEIYETRSLVATGKITEVHAPEPEMAQSLPVVEELSDITLTTDEIYKELRIRHYEYSGDFKGIISSDFEGVRGELKWNDNYITFIDTMLQFCIIGYLGVRVFCVPIGIEQIIIQPMKMNMLEKGSNVIVNVNKKLRIIQAGGIKISGLRTQVMPTRHSHSMPVLERYAFTPYSNAYSTQFPESEANKHGLCVILQIVLENWKEMKPNVVEVAGRKCPENLLAIEIMKIFKDEPMVYANMIEVVNDTETFSQDETLSCLGIKFLTHDSLSKLKNDDIHLLVGSDVLTNNDLLIVAEYLKPGAFVLLEESQNVNVTECVHNWVLVCHYMCGDKQLLLFRVTPAETSDPLIITFTEKKFDWIEVLKHALKETETNGKRVIVINQGETLSGIVGMMNCLRKEFPAHNLRCFFIQDHRAPVFSLYESLYMEQLNKDLFMNVYKNNSWGSYRHLKLENISTKEVEHAHIGIQVPSNLNTLTWMQSPTPSTSNICHVYFAALNFKDIMLASGRLPVTGEASIKALTLGFEFSGHDQNGKRIFGIVERNGMATTVVTNPNATYNVPNHWSLEEAATVPVVYITAYYALIIRGKMKSKQSVLIHAGCGGVGLAAITIALHMGVTVYTTVGSHEKRNFLKKRFLQLTDRNIANSRDTSFEEHILKETKGAGVNLVLNSLADDKLQASLRCLGKNGKFLEIGKYDLVMNTPLGGSFFLNNISFHGIILDDLLGKENNYLSTIFKLLDDGIKSGVVQPLPTTVFSEENIADAFKYLGSAKHIGKVLLKLCEEQESKHIAWAKKKYIPAVSKVYCDPKKAYIIVGGLGGFGLELADWLVSRGAMKLVLTSKTGIKDGYQASCIKIWKSKKVSVKVSTVDCTEENGVLELIQESSKDGSIGGIFNLAAVLKDNVLENLTEEDFVISCKPKVNITRHIDKLSRQLCTELDYFVVFSSVACGRGNSQQCNYGLANSAVERICEARKDANLPALAIEWGPIGDVGMAARIMHGKSIEVLGMMPQRISSCLSMLDTLLTQTNPIVSSMVVADKKGTTTSKELDFLELFGEIMGISNIKETSSNTTLAQLGADSFIVTSIKQTLERDHNKVLSPDEIRNLTLGQIKEFSERKEYSNVKLLDVLQHGLERTTNVPDDELPVHVPTEILVKLPSSNMDIKNEKNVFFIHPIQGVVTMLKPLASMLPAHIWGLQYTDDCPYDSLQNLANYCIQQIKTVQPIGPYIISGYSFGAALCFELALQLEKAEEGVTAIMLDGSVITILGTQQNIAKVKTKITDEVSCLLTFLFQCGYDKTFEAYSYLAAIKTWEEQVFSVAKIVSKDLNVSNDQVKEAINLFHRRFLVTCLYKPMEKFLGDLILIKSNYFKSTSQVDKFYGLNEVCFKPVVLHEIDDSHDGIIKNKGSLKIIQDIFKKVIEKQK